MECKVKNDIGTVFISEDVLLKVIGYAALECYGIVEMVSRRFTDTLAVLVKKDGPACHTGTDSCFNDVIFEGEEPPAFQYQDLMEMLIGRKENPKEGSYTTYLFNKGVDFFAFV